MTEPAFVFSRILPPDVSARVVTEPNRLNVETSTPLVWLPGVSDPVLRYDPTFCETPLGIARVVTEPRRLNVEASAPATNAWGSATRTRGGEHVGAAQLGSRRQDPVSAYSDTSAPGLTHGW